MRSHARALSAIFFAAVIAACSSSSSNGSTSQAPDAGAAGSNDGGGDANDAGKPSTAPDSGATSGDGGADPYKAVYDAVDESSLKGLLRQIAGVDAVKINGNDVNITDRWSAANKANFRAFFRQYFEALGATVTETTFTPVVDTSQFNVVPGETMGTNIEAVLTGDSPDSLVIITHYDTVGIKGMETANPGADDDGTGNATMFEAARIFAAIPHRKNTVRFVAADYEEISKNLDGDYAYAQYLLNKSNADGFRIIAASDNDQIGWSCWKENASLCRKLSGGLTFPTNSTLELVTCSGDSKGYDYPELRDGFLGIARTYQTAITPSAICDGIAETDHYPFWVLGIPAYAIDEWGSDTNPHYDNSGGDTIDKIDFDYLTAIAKIQIAFQATLMGIE